MSEIFPDDWKCARVTPLFKQCASSDLSNYQPISVISVVAECSRACVRSVVKLLYNSEEIISEQKSGFRSLQSTVTALLLLEVTDSWALTDIHPIYNDFNRNRKVRE